MRRFFILNFFFVSCIAYGWGVCGAESSRKECAIIKIFKKLKTLKNLIKLLRSFFEKLKFLKALKLKVFYFLKI
jgi:hypothetical protein